jgi:hypothetical protein
MNNTNETSATDAAIAATGAPLKETQFLLWLPHAP